MDDDPKDAAARREFENRKSAKQARRDWRVVLAKPEGRRVLAEIVFDVCAALEAPAPGQGEFRQGRRSVGLELIERVNAIDSEAAIALIAERMKHGGSDERPGDE